MPDPPPSPDTKALLTPTKVLMQLAGFAVGLALLITHYKRAGNNGVA